MRNSVGFSLTELMIVVAIVTILAAVAVPNYVSHVERSNRTDATAALLKLAADQERYYLQNNAYGTMANLGDPTTENDWYTLTITGAGATTFTATATAKSTGSQADDTMCKVFSITAQGLRTASDSGTADSTDSCW